MEFKKGDTVFFASIGRLVNEGVVEDVQGAFIQMKVKGHGTEYIMARHAFRTREELTASRSYHSMWMQQNSLRRARMSVAGF